MAKIKGLGLTAESNEIRTFHCPNCAETINTTMSNCPQCASPIDHTAAKAELAAVEKLLQACTVAGYLRLMALAIPVLYLLSWIPEIGVVGRWGYTILFFAVPVAVIGWWIRYRSIKTDDRAFKRAKRSTIIPLAILAAMLVVWEVAPVFYLAHILSKNSSTVAVIRDSDDVYWALPVSKIKQSGISTITLERDALVAKGSGNGSSAYIAEQLLSRAASLPESPTPGLIIIGFDFSVGEPGKLSGKVEVTLKDTEINVGEVVRSKSFK